MVTGVQRRRAPHSDHGGYLDPECGAVRPCWNSLSPLSVVPEVAFARVPSAEIPHGSGRSRSFWAWVPVLAPAGLEGLPFDALGYFLDTGGRTRSFLRGLLC